jgi:hypothetical protein
MVIYEYLSEICAAHAEPLEVAPNGVMLGVEHFGYASAPLVLLVGGPTMLSWPGALCEALARGDFTSCGRPVVVRHTIGVVR